MTVSEQYRQEVDTALAPLRAMLDRSWSELARLEAQTKTIVKLGRHFEHMGYGRVGVVEMAEKAEGKP